MTNYATLRKALANRQHVELQNVTAALANELLAKYMLTSNPCSYNHHQIQNIADIIRTVIALREMSDIELPNIYKYKQGWPVDFPNLKEEILNIYSESGHGQVYQQLLEAQLDNQKEIVSRSMRLSSISTLEIEFLSFPPPQQNTYYNVPFYAGIVKIPEYLIKSYIVGQLNAKYQRIQQETILRQLGPSLSNKIYSDSTIRKLFSYELHNFVVTQKYNSITFPTYGIMVNCRRNQSSNNLRSLHHVLKKIDHMSLGCMLNSPPQKTFFSYVTYENISAVITTGFHPCNRCKKLIVPTFRAAEDVSRLLPKASRETARTIFNITTRHRVGCQCRKNKDIAKQHFVKCFKPLTDGGKYA